MPSLLFVLTFLVVEWIFEDELADDFLSSCIFIFDLDFLDFLDFLDVLDVLEVLDVLVFVLIWRKSGEMRSGVILLYMEFACALAAVSNSNSFLSKALIWLLCAAELSWKVLPNFCCFAWYCDWYSMPSKLKWNDFFMLFSTWANLLRFFFFFFFSEDGKDFEETLLWTIGVATIPCNNWLTHTGGTSWTTGTTYLGAGCVFDVDFDVFGGFSFLCFSVLAFVESFGFLPLRFFSTAPWPSGISESRALAVLAFRFVLLFFPDETNSP